MSATRTPIAPPRAQRRPVLVAVVGLIVAMFGVVVGSGTASAHTSFESSTPANGAMLVEPVDEIRIAFTNPAQEAGDGFVVLDPAGQVRAPSSVTTEDGTVFVLAFDPPLDGGQVGVRWRVRAGDAHPIEGSFSFTVGDAAAMASATDAAATSGHDMGSMSADEMAAMDEFLAVDQSRPGESLARIGRLVSFAAIVLGIGAMAFAATTLRGSRNEIESLITAIRILGGVLVVGAIAEYAGVSRIADEALTSTLTSSAGIATLLARSAAASSHSDSSQRPPRCARASARCRLRSRLPSSTPAATRSTTGRHDGGGRRTARRRWRSSESRSPSCRSGSTVTPS